jgi:hypothetical protein
MPVGDGTIRVRVTTANAAGLRMPLRGQAKSPSDHKYGAVQRAPQDVLCPLHIWHSPEALIGADRERASTRMNNSIPPRVSATRSGLRVGDDPSRDHALHALVESCLRFGRYQPQELLRWLVDDVLAGFGLRAQERHPEDARDWIQHSAAAYAALAARHPFAGC